MMYTKITIIEHAVSSPGSNNFSMLYTEKRESQVKSIMFVMQERETSTEIIILCLQYGQVSKLLNKVYCQKLQAKNNLNRLS